MGNNAAIDVAIALMLMYLVLSLVVTVLNEMIAAAVDLRASNLRAALVYLLDNDMLRRDFYNHGLVAGINNAVSIAPKSLFGRFIAWLCRGVTHTAKPTDDSHVSYLSGKIFALALLGSIDPTKPFPALQDINDAIAHMPDSNIRDTLLAYLATANGNLEKLRDDVATWFDDSMDRVSGVYKRYLKRISIIVGFFVVLVVNADSVKVAKSLWSDAPLRQEMVQAADAYVSRTARPGAGDPGRSAGDANEYQTPGADISGALRGLQSATDQLRPLPLGWRNAWPGLGEATSSPFLVVLISKCIGLVLTTVAISLGAPFWFDLLAMFMRVRSAGEKPKKSADTPPLN